MSPPEGVQRGDRRLRVSPPRSRCPRLSPCAAVILEFGTDEQKLRHIPAILKRRGALDAVPVRAQRRLRRGRGADHRRPGRGAMGAQRVQGVDIGAWWSDWGLCLARTNWDVPKHRGLTVFMLPIHQPNVEVHRIEMHNGSREFCQEFMTDVDVPDTDRVGDVDEGWTVGTRWMFHERMLFNSPYVTEPVGMTHGSHGRQVWSATWPGEAGLQDDTATRERIGEARMLELVGQPAGRSESATALPRASMSDQAAALVRLFKGTAQSAGRTRSPSRRPVRRAPPGPSDDPAAWAAHQLHHAPGAAPSGAARPRWPATSSANACSPCRGSDAWTRTCRSATCPRGRPSAG